MNLPHLLVAAIVCLFWGCNVVAAKIGVTHFPPIFFTALRFLAVLVILLPWLQLRPVRGQWGTLLPAVFFMGALHFALLKKLAAECRLASLSMGMSADFETAIRFGATHVRVGTAIFGEREA